jgi:nitrate/TMAO reductase-like tetraheme cytochrome c subunit
MIREMWRILKTFVVDFTRELGRGLRENKKGLFISFCVLCCVLAVVVMIALKATASTKFCASCHYMRSYIESWEQSSHKDVSCTGCHFEPGLFGQLEGKWKAQLHVIMKITGTAPPRPHTQLSDASCLQEGCHSRSELSEGAVTYKGVKFDHGAHLGELRRGKQLRCTTCHSQIVQGQHLTVTETTCFQCHFYEGDAFAGLSECQTCHVQTKAKIFIDANENMPFVHKDYLDRGVLCEQCHFDIVHGDGHLKDNICVQCHSEPDILMADRTYESIHRHHVTEHKVECFRCHTTIEHGVVRPVDPHLEMHEGTKTRPTIVAKGVKHYDADCAKCHTFDQHETIRLMYMGTGAQQVPDMPSPMFKAHADCGSCHIHLQKSGVEIQTSYRLSYDKAIQSCADCHGEGYDDVAKHWKKILTDELKKTQDSIVAARRAVGQKPNGESGKQAAQVLSIAESNLSFVRNGRGLHNMDYALRVLADARKRAEQAMEFTVPQYVARTVDSPTGCTQLCHSCVECIETTPVPFGNVQFPHDVHVNEEGFDCEECHSPREQHGQTLLTNCNECHHGSGVGAVECQDCHVENHNLYNGQNACDELSCDVRGEKNPMAEAIECSDCHLQVVDDEATTADALKAECVECHDGDEAYAAMVDDWKTKVETLKIGELQTMLEETQRMILRAIRNGQYTYDAQDLVNKAEKNLKLIVVGNPVHNVAFSEDLAIRVRDLITQARKTLQTHSTVKTLDLAEYK